MPATTQSANEVARKVSTALHRPVSAKQVRGWARDNMARFDKSKPANARNLTHAYTAVEAQRIVAAMVARAGGRTRSAKATPAKPRAKRTTAPRTPATAPSAPTGTDGQ